MDFDGFAKKADMLAKKDEFTKDKHTLAVFISPSGDGLKLLVKVYSSRGNFFCKR